VSLDNVVPGSTDLSSVPYTTEYNPIPEKLLAWDLGSFSKGLFITPLMEYRKHLSRFALCGFQ